MKIKYFYMIRVSIDATDNNENTNREFYPESTFKSRVRSSDSRKEEMIVGHAPRPDEYYNRLWIGFLKFTRGH